MIWLLLYSLASASAGWLYFSIGTRERPVPTVDRALFAIPAGVLLVSIATFTANWLLSVRFTRFSVLGCAVGLNLLLLAAIRMGVPASVRLRVTTNVKKSTLLLLGVGGLSILAFAVWAGRLSLLRPLDGWDFYLYHWHYTRVMVESGSLPLEVSPSYLQAQYAYPPLVSLVYGQLSAVLGGLSQLGPRLVPLLCLTGMVLVAARMAHVCLRISVHAALCAGSFAIWSGYYVSHGLEENNDVPNAFFTIAAAYWLLRRDAAPWSKILGGGLLLAGAYWSRYNGLALFGVLAIVLAGTALWERFRGGDWRWEIAVGAGGLGAGLLIASPHMIRNLILWGNPVYPAFANWLGGYLVDPWVLQHVLSFTLTPVPFAGLSSDWWLHPFRYFPETGLAIAILFAAVAPAINRLRRGEIHAAQLVLAATLYCALSLLVMRPANAGDLERYLIPMVALVAPLAGLVFEEITRRSWLGIATVVVLLTMIAWYVMDEVPLILRNYSLLLALLVLMPVVVSRTRLIGGRLGPGLRVDLLPLFVLPFAMFVAANSAARPHPGYLVEGGLLRFPEAPVMSSFAPADKYLTFEDRRELLAGEPFPADHPFLERFYRERLGGDDGVRELKRLGVRYIYWSTRFFWDHPFMHESPLYAELDDRQLFDRIYHASNGLASVDIYELR